MKILNITRWIFGSIFVGLIILGQLTKFPEFLFAVVSLSLFGFIVLSLSHQLENQEANSVCCEA